ncbi:MAG: response regulator [Pseudomonadota bacterium]
MSSYIPRILIVDDEPHICDSLKFLLQRQGYDIYSANSGKEAVTLLAAHTFDLLLLDMVIPDMSGYQIMDHVNACSYDVLTIVITGNASIESAVTALRKGAYDYLKKPFEYEELLKRVGNALQNKKLALEKKIIDGKLERSEERYQYLVQNSPDIIYILDAEGTFTFINITVQRELGYDPRSLLGKSFLFFVHEDDAVKARFFISREKPPHAAPAHIQLKFKLSEHSAACKLFEIEHSPIELTPVAAEENFFGTYGVARNITYRKQLEDQLHHAKKMEAIGTLAGGIAHDFNNILMGIMGYTSLILSDLEPDNPYYTRLQSIEQHVRSGANLTRQLLSFARGGNYDVKPADINDIIEKTSGMFARTKKEISLSCTYATNGWTAEVDAGQIEQVLLNLYVNAWQAMPGGGTMYVATESITLDELPAHEADLAAGSYIKITIKDTGIGMDEEVRQRIFEPFFTTKGAERGTGLGLASAYGIIKNHGGNITVDSKKGQGTTFTIYIPASDKPVLIEEAPAGDIIKGSETILLVDDEQAMIDVGSEILGAIGYKVITAGSGREAIKAYADNLEKIDILIVDLIMPEIGGGELCKKVRALNPQARVLMSSGYSIEGDMAAGLQGYCNGFIQKPFAIKELSQKIREILEQKLPLH